jgi:deaminated glutathione amidase
MSSLPVSQPPASGLAVACVQMRSGVDVAANVAEAIRLTRQAASEGARLIATPEMTTLMDRAPGAVFAKSFAEADDPSLPVFRTLAAELGVTLLLGSIPVRVDSDRAQDGMCANRSFLIGPEGSVLARYDKIHMFDVQLNDRNVYRESDSFQPGCAAVVAPAEGARLGLAVCYDVRFPHLFRDLAKAGAQIVAVPAAFTRITGEAHWHVLLRARAIETGAFILAPAQGGRHEDGRETYGRSLVVSPWGDVLAEAPGAEPGVVHAMLDLGQVEAARGRIPALAHDRAYDPPVLSDRMKLQNEA